MARIGRSRFVSIVLVPILAVALLGMAGSAWAAERRAAPADHALYDRYCGSCHGDLGGPTRALRSGASAAPDLRELTSVHGQPLPRAALTWFVLDPRHRGSARVCSDRPFSWAPPGPGTGVMRRGMVLQVLRYLETIQRPATAPPGPSTWEG